MNIPPKNNNNNSYLINALFIFELKHRIQVVMLSNFIRHIDKHPYILED